MKRAAPAPKTVNKIRDRVGWDAIGYGSVALEISHSVPDAFHKRAEMDLRPSLVTAYAAAASVVLPENAAMKSQRIA